MKPDAFMPFYFRSFWEAVAMWDDATIVAYLRCITYYWGHSHCEGLKDDEPGLRKLCHADKIETADWIIMRDRIFDNQEFFTQDGDGLWHQKFAAEKWIEVQKNYDKAVDGGKRRAAGLSKEARSEIARAGGLAMQKNRRYRDPLA